MLVTEAPSFKFQKEHIYTTAFLSYVVGVARTVNAFNYGQFPYNRCTWEN